jgi:hypothetical protein
MHPLLADTYAPARLEELHSDARHRRLIRTAAPPRRRDGRRPRWYRWL